MVMTYFCFCQPTLLMLLQGEVPAQCTPGIMRAIVRQHLASPAMWCILPIQVHVPGTRIRCRTETCSGTPSLQPA